MKKLLFLVVLLLPMLLFGGQDTLYIQYQTYDTIVEAPLEVDTADFTSLATALITTIDLTTTSWGATSVPGDSLVVLIRGDWPGHDTVTSPSVLNQWYSHHTDAFIVVKAIGAARHSGDYCDTCYVMYGNYSGSLLSPDDGDGAKIFDGLQFVQGSSVGLIFAPSTMSGGATEEHIFKNSIFMLPAGGSFSISSNNGAYLWFNNCVMHATFPTGAADVISFTSSTTQAWFFHNSLFRQWRLVFHLGTVNASTIVEMVNCTMTGVELGSSWANAKVLGGELANGGTYNLQYNSIDTNVINDTLADSVPEWPNYYDTDPIYLSGSQLDSNYHLASNDTANINRGVETKPLTLLENSDPNYFARIDYEDNPRDTGYILITGTTNIEDARITTGGDNTFNYGGEAGADQWINSTFYRFLIKTVGLSSLFPVDPVVDSMRFWFYVSTPVTGATISGHRVYKPYNEGNISAVAPDADSGLGFVTGLAWSATGELWTTNGAGYAKDTCCDNSGNGVYPDRAATAQGSFDGSTVGWKSLFVSGGLGQGWVTGDSINNGLLLISDLSGLLGVYSTESSTNQPYVEVFLSHSWDLGPDEFVAAVGGDPRFRTLPKHYYGGAARKQSPSDSLIIRIGTP